MIALFHGKNPKYLELEDLSTKRNQAKVVAFTGQSTLHWAYSIIIFLFWKTTRQYKIYNLQLLHKQDFHRSYITSTPVLTVTVVYWYYSWHLSGHVIGKLNDLVCLFVVTQKDWETAPESS